MDITIKRLFELACDRSGEIPSNITVVATGGYGQKCLAPWSDVDLTFLVDRTDDPPILREAFQLVMDVLLSDAEGADVCPHPDGQGQASAPPCGGGGGG